jgi:hypothetical protein
MNQKKRSPKEICISKDYLKNKNTNVIVGTTKDKDNPSTIYINTNFWVKPKERKVNAFLNDKKNLRVDFKNSLINNIEESLNSVLKDNFYFKNSKDDNIYIYSIPQNFFNNKKFCYVAVELYLRTTKKTDEKEYPLDDKNNTELYQECLNITNVIGNKLKKMETGYEFKTKKNV